MQFFSSFWLKCWKLYFVKIYIKKSKLIYKNSFSCLKIVEASFCGPRNCPYPICSCSADDDTCNFFLDECSPAILDNETDRELRKIISWDQLMPHLPQFLVILLSRWQQRSTYLWGFCNKKKHLLCTLSIPHLEVFSSKTSPSLTNNFLS